MKHKKTAGIILAALLLAALMADFHVYRPRSKTLPETEGGIILSITTYDGESETRPFVKCLGHTWLSVENRTGHSVNIKDYALQDGAQLTFSVWAISGHRGVVFNLEPAFIEALGRYAGRRSLNVCIEESQLQTISDYIDRNDCWGFAKNCSYWSVQLWNALAGEEYALKTQTLLYTPKRLEKSFREFDAVETDRDFSGAGPIFIYRDGVRTELELCP